MKSPIPLERGETLLWVGQPEQRAYANSYGFLAIFGFIFFIMSVMSISSVKHPAIPVVFAGFGLLWMLLPYWYEKRAKRVWYVLTDRRVIILNDHVFKPLESLRLEDIPFLERRIREGGFGDILFFENYESQPPSRHGFVGVPEPDHVERLFRSALAKRGNAKVAGQLSEAIEAPFFS
jgi:hypothetical protein